MNELNSDIVSMTVITVTALFLVAGLAAWFFVNRASSRINTQIMLLDAILDQQKRQTALLRRLCEVSKHKAVQPALEHDDDEQESDGLVRMVAER